MLEFENHEDSYYLHDMYEMNTLFGKHPKGEGFWTRGISLRRSPTELHKMRVGDDVVLRFEFGGIEGFDWTAAQHY